MLRGIVSLGMNKTCLRVLLLVKHFSVLALDQSLVMNLAVPIRTNHSQMLAALAESIGHSPTTLYQRTLFSGSFINSLWRYHLRI